MGRKSKLSKIRSDAMKKWHAERKGSGLQHGRAGRKYSVAVPAGEKTDLSFLETFGQRESTWNYGRAKKLVQLLKAGKTISACARYFTLGEATIKTMILELKRAYKASMTLEDYFKKGRPLQYGKQVIVK